MKRFAICLGVAALLAAATAVVAPGAGAGTISSSAEIVKVVDGPGPADAVYSIEVSCEESGDTTVDLMDGQSDAVPFLPGELCTVTEVVTNGAESVGYTCLNLTGVNCVTDQSFRVEPDSIMNPRVRVTVTNTFTPEPTTTTTSTTVPSTTTTVAPAVAATPAFTG